MTLDCTPFQITGTYPNLTNLADRAKYFTVSSDSETDDEPNNTA